jgi:hypothetical protein
VTLVAVEDSDRELHLRGELKLKYEAIAARLGPNLALIKVRINEMVDGDRIHTSSWMPGRNWTGTPFQAIYEASGRDQEEAAKNFGLIIWKVFEERPESWASAHGMHDGREIRGRTYFRWPNPDL